MRSRPRLPISFRSIESRTVSASFLFAGVLLFALSAYGQTTAQGTTDQRPPSPPKTADHSQTQGGGAQGGLEILSDTMGVDFGPYLSKDVLPHVREHWYNLIPEIACPPIMKEGKVAIEFAITKDGSVAGMRLVATSGDVAMDRAAWGGIAASNPFPPLPSEFKGQYLALRFYFHYNPGPDDMALTGAIEDVRKKSHENLRGDKDAATDLTRDVKALSSIVDKGQVSIADQVSGRYYRGYAIYLLGWLYNVQGQPIDMDLAKQALLDFDRVIASNTEVAGLKNSKAQAGDLAGQIAWDQTRSSSLAYSYWSKCAEEGHAGCVYEIASRNLIHEGERPPDFGKALELYTMAFYTGVDYQCVGAYSAREIARILYFTGTRRAPDDTPLAWVQKSYVLSDQVEQREKRKNVCAGASARIDEFLYRLSAGDRRDELLNQASALVDDNSPETAIVLKYLSGSLDATGFQAQVKTFKGEQSRCSLYFRGMWYAQILKNHATAEEYLKHLSEDGQFWCQTEVEFAKKLHD